uniref:ATP synthase F0 subunit 6 n=1 Tax=Venerupis aspera TaxID=2784313 RepID=UPI001BF02A3D|nr:ATP synthase F0 subunit 6 [Venerupis aspera]YP_010455420.1 ATP synthase F0 subunit 6 [Ruditapes variegatus]QUA05875.1 ATP synthase F0 subunit 6 [Venerupis aspera]UUA63025.1 ATP synthase subunit 6 [Ruditapes variegatus]
MTMDLFSMFDYAWGGSYLSAFVVWFSGLMVVFFICSFMIYFYSVSDLEAIILTVSDSILKEMPGKSKVCSGTSFLVTSLYLVLFPTCVLGYFPYSFSLGAHFVISASLSFPFWFMTFMININPNWRLAWIKVVYEGSSFIPTFMVLVSEWISLVIRPFTLAARLSLNLIVGSLLMKIFFSYTVGLFLPFSYSLFSLGLPVLSSLMAFSISFLIGFVEICLMVVQATIFVTLIVFYAAEVLVKPE